MLSPDGISERVYLAFGYGVDHVALIQCCLCGRDYSFAQDLSRNPPWVFFFLRRLLNNYFSVGAQSRGTVSLGEQSHLTGLILKGIFTQIFVRCLPSFSLPLSMSPLFLSLPLSCMFGLRLHKVLLYRESKMYCRSAPGVRCKKGNENNRSNENLTMPANT